MCLKRICPIGPNFVSKLENVKKLDPVFRVLVKGSR